LVLIRVIVGIATFFDTYTVLAVALAMPRRESEWKAKMAGSSANRHGSKSGNERMEL
jgi:hypothetical protein